MRFSTAPKQIFKTNLTRQTVSQLSKIAVVAELSSKFSAKNLTPSFLSNFSKPEKNNSSLKIVNIQSVTAHEKIELPFSDPINLAKKHGRRSSNMHTVATRMGQ